MSPRLIHFAINSDDAEATLVFYADVFGWTFQANRPAGFAQVMDKAGDCQMLRSSKL